MSTLLQVGGGIHFALLEGWGLAKRCEGARIRLSDYRDDHAHETTKAMKLQDLGWDEFFDSQTFREFEGMETVPARVSRHDGQEYDVVLDGGEMRRARLGGGLRYRTASPEELPAVGDWVVLRCEEEGELDTILGVYERRTCFVRQAAGQRTGVQVISANVDTVFVVTSMNEDFEPRRLERYLVAVRNAGAEPVIVLNKADLAEDPSEYVGEAEPVANGAPVVTMSALDGTVEPLEEWLKPGETLVFVGSSGVGKSTIINRLMGDEVMETGGIREDDAKGRHTTTTRQLLVLPGGHGVLIDTPGMREFQLWAGDALAEDAFEDVAELAMACRFRDCQHDAEPGCAVQAALEDGELAEERFASWQKLQAELEAHQLRQDVAARRSEGRRQGRVIKRMKKDHPKY